MVSILTQSCGCTGYGHHRTLPLGPDFGARLSLGTSALTTTNKYVICHPSNGSISSNSRSASYLLAQTSQAQTNELLENASPNTTHYYDGPCYWASYERARFSSEVLCVSQVPRRTSGMLWSLLGRNRSSSFPGPRMNPMSFALKIGSLSTLTWAAPFTDYVLEQPSSYLIQERSLLSVD